METESKAHIIGILPVWEKASWKTQQLITAITAAVISSLAVVAVGQVEAKLGGTVGVKPVPALALGTAIAVGAVTFALQQIGINQFNRDPSSSSRKSQGGITARIN